MNGASLFRRDGNASGFNLTGYNYANPRDANYAWLQQVWDYRYADTQTFDEMKFEGMLDATYSLMSGGLYDIARGNVSYATAFSMLPVLGNFTSMARQGHRAYRFATTAQRTYKPVVASMPKLGRDLTLPSAGATNTQAVTGGSSKNLGRNLMESMGLPRTTPWGGYQAQHLVPSQLRNHPVLQKIGMQLDDASNGVFLPSARAKSKDVASALPRHTGSHPAYTEAVRRQLNNLDVNASASVLRQQVSDLQQRLRNLHKQGVPVRNKDGATTDLWMKLLSQ